MRKPRKAKRITIELTPEQIEQLRRDRETILREEKDELTSWANKQRRETVRGEIAEVAKLLKSERKSQGLSLADVEEKTGISRAALSRLENVADANPTVGTLQRIALRWARN